MNAKQFAGAFQKLVESGKNLPLKTFSGKPNRKFAAAVPKVLIFSPHPDDECIVGALALRLLREAKWNVINVAVTLGSKRERQNVRRCEVRRACAELGFNLIFPSPRGLENINLETRKKNPTLWKAATKIIAKIISENSPRVIFLPHEKDGHPTHIGVHFLVLDALKSLPKNFSCFVVVTEFWGQMENPNLLVESSTPEVGDLVSALARHVGEVRRNAYHARLPAWMIDNVRRGAELVGGQGGKAPDFIFGTIYRLQKWENGKLKIIFQKRLLSCGEKADSLFV